MAVQEIIKHTYKDLFTLSTVEFEKACTIDHSIQKNAYSIYWIQEGKGTYNIDFEKYKNSRLRNCFRQCFRRTRRLAF